MNLKDRLPGPLYRFLYPGIALKRWSFLLIVSSVVLIAGATGITGEALTGRTFHVRSLQRMERNVRRHWTGLRALDRWLIALGAIGMVFAVRRGYYAILTVVLPRGERDLVRLAYQRARRKRGPRIVAIGGGTGLPNLLTGLKEYTDNLTAIVTVADDGGSSGRLRKQFGILPPGDLRNCLVALADEEPLMSRLFQHRFSKKGDLEGHTFGNLYLTALAEISGDFTTALAESHRILAVRGRVVPVTPHLVQLAAKLRNGRTVRGESRIAKAGSPITGVHLIPARPRANPEAVRAIAKADIIVFGPGSLYTSIVPNLLVPEIREAIVDSRNLKLYVCNIMTEPGETDGFTAGDHVEVLVRYLKGKAPDAVVVNVEMPDDGLLIRYRTEHAELVLNDEIRIRQLGSRVVRGRVLSERADFIRHDSAKLSRVIMKYAVI
ncbi:MAG: uridine diphosphate-N-acetylglucosamine-binding protein YvcK [Candidatus Coatesbacteria bacterium]